MILYIGQLKCVGGTTHSLIVALCLRLVFYKIFLQNPNMLKAYKVTKITFDNFNNLCLTIFMIMMLCVLTYLARMGIRILISAISGSSAPDNLVADARVNF